MTIEQKAKAYDEAIKVAENMHKFSSDPAEIKRMEQIFPELAESEDEKIRKSLITLLQHFCKGYRVPGLGFPVSYKDMLAWLEKQGEKTNNLSPQEAMDIAVAKCFEQGEQKPADKAESKFNEGDWAIVSTSEGDRVVQIASVEYFKDGHPMYITTEGRWFGNGTKARLLTYEENTILLESEAIKSKSWSEEDKTILNNLIYALANDRIGNNRDEYVEWLKSLKDRYTWKPTKEQMAALSDLNLTGGISYAGQGQELINLYNDLKKLREE